jgi:hypothetical protein
MATENIVLLAFAALLGTLHLVGGPLSGIVRPSAPRRRRGSPGPPAPVEERPLPPPPRQTLEFSTPDRAGEEDRSHVRDATGEPPKRRSPDAAA